MDQPALSQAGLEVIVANSRKLRAKLARVDKTMLHLIRHIGEASQRDLLLFFKLRDSLVRQRLTLLNARLPQVPGPASGADDRGGLGVPDVRAVQGAGFGVGPHP